MILMYKIMNLSSRYFNSFDRQAFLQKRWTKKDELPGQMYIVESLKSIENSLQQQELYPLTRLVD